MEKIVEYFKDLNLDPNLERVIYAGGRGVDDKKPNSHAKYYSNKFKNNYELPSEQSHCICGHKIRENCFVKHPDHPKLIVVGNCCIKKFLPEENRVKRCVRCDEPIPRRRKPMCKACEEYYCKCGNECHPKEGTCLDCFENEITTCVCGEKKDRNYNYCEINCADKNLKCKCGSEKLPIQTYCVKCAEETCTYCGRWKDSSFWQCFYCYKKGTKRCANVNCRKIYHNSPSCYCYTCAVIYIKPT